MQDTIATVGSEGKLMVKLLVTLIHPILRLLWGTGMNTTAGSFSLLGSVVPEDAGVVKRLRKAGAIILGEWNALD